MPGPIGLPDRYRLDGLIATGGMAAVYAAHDTVLDRPVAVKVLAEHLTENPDAKARFEREARAAAALSGHPAVVTIYDVGEHEGRSFIVMERRMGSTVQHEIKQSHPAPIEHERALGWLKDIAEVLDAAHARGIIHRDIKPGNLLLDEHDRVAVADFGIASLAHEHERVTQTGEVLGTGAYLAPEQAAGGGAGPTSASDRYALACVAYELLTGRQPFEGNFAAQIRAHAEDPPPAAPGLPDAAQDVLKQGLAKAPEARWATATAFVRALDAALAGTRDETRSMVRGAAAAPPPARGQRRTLPLVAAALGALLLIAAVALAVTSGDDEPARTTAKQEQRAKKRDKKPKRTPTAAPVQTEAATAPPATPEPTATATEEPTQPPAEEETDTGNGEVIEGDPSELNAEGFSRLRNGDAAGALPYLQGAVQGCGGSAALDPCGYAYYNLGVALNAVGDYTAAANVLTQRLQRWPTDQRGTVKKALREACQGAGGSNCSST